jgi:hypothetical protein
MQKLILYIVLITLSVLFSGSSFAETVPKRIAGFELGTNIGQYSELLQMDKALAIRHMEYLTEVETKPMAGYKSGYIYYGNCDRPGTIVKIKLKYLREDKEFFETLLEQFKKKFGKPGEYKGDVFRAFVAWKWSFKDKDNNRISLILQHNSEGDEDYTSGNSVKMSITSRIEAERECHKKNLPSNREDVPAGDRIDLKNLDMGRFIPE